MHRAATIAKGVGAAVALAALVVGVPLLLWRAGGPPLPADAFDWDKVSEAANDGITPGAVTGILLFVCWAAWAVLAWALLAEAWNRVVGRSTRQVRGMTPLQLFAGKLVAAAFFVGTGAFAGGGGSGRRRRCPPRAGPGGGAHGHRPGRRARRPRAHRPRRSDAAAARATTSYVNATRCSASPASSSAIPCGGGRSGP